VRITTLLRKLPGLSSTRVCNVSLDEESLVPRSIHARRSQSRRVAEDQTRFSSLRVATGQQIVKQNRHHLMIWSLKASARSVRKIMRRSPKELVACASSVPGYLVGVASSCARVASAAPRHGSGTSDEG